MHLLILLFCPSNFFLAPTNLFSKFSDLSCRLSSIVSSLTARQQTIAARFHNKERIASNSAPGLAFADGSPPRSSQQDQHHLVVANHPRNQDPSHLHELATF